MEVETISRETIKPSSPTPPHLKTFKISLLDRIFPKWFVPFITYYAIKDPNEFCAERLKRSLAETLTRFYPLAGRPNYNDHTIDCNDNGVLFLTVRVKCRLADVLKDPKIEEFSKFIVPLPPICPDGDGMAQIGIQLNVFECGGVALSLCFFHLICDGVTMTAFMKCWSELARSSQDQIVDMYPCFPAADLFPQGDEPIPVDSSDFMKEMSLIKEGKGVIRRFAFDKQAIASLREKARSERVPNPTRVEAVSMFIWKHCMLASTEVWGAREASLWNVKVNLRRRMVPPLSEYSVGNIFSKVTTLTGAEDETNIDRLVSSFRTAMEEGIEKLIPMLKNNEGRDSILKYVEELGEICRDTNLNPYNMTSWCRMGFIDMNFGWGKPVWVSQVGSNDVRSAHKNNVTLIDGNGGENIELWLILGHREMIVLENNLDFLAFASLNPPILI